MLLVQWKSTETRLGLQLIHRTTRRFSLTDEGGLFDAGAVGLLADLDELTDSLRARVADVAGHCMSAALSVLVGITSRRPLPISTPGIRG